MNQETQLEQDLRAGKCGRWRTPLPVTGVDTIVNNQPAAPYNGNFRVFCDNTVNPIDHAIDEIAYMNQKTETRTQVARSLWKARS